MIRLKDEMQDGLGARVKEKPFYFNATLFIFPDGKTGVASTSL